MITIPKITDREIADQSRQTHTILNVLMSEFTLFSTKPLTACIIPREHKDIFVIYQGQYVCLCDIVQNTINRIQMQYRRYVRLVNHAWVQYWLLGKIHPSSFVELIASHQNVLEHLHYILDNIDTSLVSSEVFMQLQREASCHESSIKALRKNMPDSAFF